MVGCVQENPNTKVKNYQTYYPISTFIIKEFGFKVFKNWKLAKDDTRRKAAFGNTYYRTNPKYGKQIEEGDEICLFTDPRDNQYNYEGFNLLIACKDAQTFKSKTPDNKGGTYGGRKVSY